MPDARLFELVTALANEKPVQASEIMNTLMGERVNSALADFARSTKIDAAPKEVVQDA